MYCFNLFCFYVGLNIPFNRYSKYYVSPPPHLGNGYLIAKDIFYL